MAEMLVHPRNMTSQGYRKVVKEVCFHHIHAFKKAVSVVKKYMAGQFIYFVRWESQKLVHLELSRENGVVYKNRAIEIAMLKKNFSAAASTAKKIAEPRGR